MEFLKGDITQQWMEQLRPIGINDMLLLLNGCDSTNEGVGASLPFAAAAVTCRLMLSVIAIS